jgi:hypothetical protein
VGLEWDTTALDATSLSITRAVRLISSVPKTNAFGTVFPDANLPPQKMLDIPAARHAQLAEGFQEEDSFCAPKLPHRFSDPSFLRLLRLGSGPARTRAIRRCPRHRAD